MRCVCKLKGLCSWPSLRNYVFVGLLVYFIWTQTSVLKKMGANLPLHTSGDRAISLQKSTGERLLSPKQPSKLRHNEPLMVIIVSYQRTGSTFLGNLFAQNPDAFYAFEPLDGLYVAMYGTNPGYNVPSDITTNWDGSSRNLTEEEIDATADVLDALLTCNHASRLPNEMLLHDFWVGYKSDHKNLNPFLRCLQDNNAITLLTKDCNRIANIMYRHCGIWFGKDRNVMDKCHQGLWPIKKRSNAPKQFTKYIQCINSRRSIVDKCVPIMENICFKSKLRTSKVVRPTMRSLPILLQKHPNNLKIIHLLRGPHSVAKSRQRFSSVRGHSSGVSLIKEAKLYCRVAADDLLLRKELEDKYPNMFITVIYEKLVKDPLNGIHDIYKFLGEPVPEKVLAYFLNSSFKPDNESGWNAPKDSLVASEINFGCKDFYDNLGFDWSS